MKRNVDDSNAPRRGDANKDIENGKEALLPVAMCFGAIPIVGDVRHFRIGQVIVLGIALSCLIIIWFLAT